MTSAFVSAPPPRHSFAAVAAAAAVADASYEEGDATTATGTTTTTRYTAGATTTRPWCYADVDYSAANEYVAAHYSHRDYARGVEEEEEGVSPEDVVTTTTATTSSSEGSSVAVVPYSTNAYFGSDRSTTGKKKREPIWNARNGVWCCSNDRGTTTSPAAGMRTTTEEEEEEESMELRRASMEGCGFVLLRSPTDVTDWKDLNNVRDQYLPELRKALEVAYGGEENKILHVAFWNGVVRSGSYGQTRPEVAVGTDDVAVENEGAIRPTPTASYAPTPHIDIDVNAYGDAGDLINVLEKNDIGGGRDDDEFPRERLLDYIRRGKRFAIVNAWRNTSRKEPVLHAPLAVLSTKYKNNNKCNGEDVPIRGAFPLQAPVMSPSSSSPPRSPRSRWYTYPLMTHEEVLLFCQYDRDSSRPSDLWHCALVNVVEEGGGGGGRRRSPDNHRESFDVRCFVVFDEIVPSERDRYRKDRDCFPILNKSQSEEFCSRQARQREEKKRGMKK